MREVIFMATSSFNKDFTLKSKKAVKSFVESLENPSSSFKIDRSLTTYEKRKAGVKKLRKMLSHSENY